jgi:5-methylcytosine-specific restriction protein A
VFLYTGEGQTGDMEFVRGNRALRDHATNGKDVLLFESLGKGEGVRFVGNFDCAGWEERNGPDREGAERRVIVFHLVAADQEKAEFEPGAEPIRPNIPLDDLRRRAHEAARSVARRSAGESRRSYYERSEAVRAYVLARAFGRCEACERPAPFQRPDGSPYLEPHHILRLSDGGPDDPRWVAAICPNCHREIHHGQNGNELNKQLAERIRFIEL